MSTSKQTKENKTQEQAFLEAYQRLVKRTGYEIAFEPMFVKDEDNKYRISIAAAIVKTA